MQTLLFVWITIALTTGEPTQVRSATKWRVTKKVDAMTDKAQVTLVLPSDDGLASIRLTCSDDDQPSALFTLPKGVVIEAGMTLAEIRFDKAEPTSYLMQELKIGGLIESLGGAQDRVNLTVVADDPAQAITAGLKRPQVVAAAKSLIGGLSSATKVAYRFYMLSAGSGLQGTFSPKGFAGVEGQLGKCSASAK
jgi:hypothetical protein